MSMSRREVQARAGHYSHAHGCVGALPRSSALVNATIARAAVNRQVRSEMEVAHAGKDTFDVIELDGTRRLG